MHFRTLQPKVAMLPQVGFLPHLFCSMIVRTGAPAKLKGDDQVPYWYLSGSWLKQETVPWHAGEKRAMTPAEGVAWLAGECARAKASKRARRGSDEGKKKRKKRKRGARGALEAELEAARGQAKAAKAELEELKQQQRAEEERSQVAASGAKKPTPDDEAAAGITILEAMASMSFARTGALKIAAVKALASASTSLGQSAVKALELASASLGRTAAGALKRPCFLKAY